MKAILVMDMPNCCDECPIMFRSEEERCCMVEGRNSFTKKPSWCPLNPVPEKIGGIWSGSFVTGWNLCIDRILEKKSTVF